MDGGRIKEGEIFSASEWKTIYGDSFFQCQLCYIPPLRVTSNRLWNTWEVILLICKPPLGTYCFRNRKYYSANTLILQLSQVHSILSRLPSVIKSLSKWKNYQISQSCFRVSLLSLITLFVFLHFSILYLLHNWGGEKHHFIWAKGYTSHAGITSKAISQMSLTLVESELWAVSLKLAFAFKITLTMHQSNPRSGEEGLSILNLFFFSNTWADKTLMSL